MQWLYSGKNSDFPVHHEENLHCYSTGISQKGFTHSIISKVHMPPQAQVDQELFILLITKKENLEKTLPLASYPTRFRNWNAKLSIDPHFCAMRVLRNISFSFQAWCKRDPV